MKRKWQYGLALAVWLVYLVLSYNPAQNAASAAKYHLSSLVLIILSASLSLPFLVCWLLGVAGWSYLREYTHRLSGGVDQKGYQNILRGLTILIIGLMLPAFISSLYVHYSGSATGPVRTWVTTYSNLIFPLVGFSLMYLGSRQLLQSLQLKTTPWAKFTTVLIPISVFAIFYVSMVFSNPARQTSADPSLPATYFLPDVLIVLTIVVPVIVTWGMGLLMALNLENYSHYVRSHQKPGLVSIYNGSLAIIGGTILSQALASLGSTRLSALNLALILLLVYVLLVTIGIGYGLIARGAKRLAASDLEPSTG